jgi:RimJ/RimL family protein N-acetyltransferase
MAGLAGALGVSRLEAVCHAEHAASRRVLEKCGFTIDDSASPRAEFPNLEAGVPHRAVLYVLTPAPPVTEDA